MRTNKFNARPFDLAGSYHVDLGLYVRTEQLIDFMTIFLRVRALCFAPRETARIPMEFILFPALANQFARVRLFEMKCFVLQMYNKYYFEL